MNKATIAGAIALSTIGIAVVAHNGATGVVLDRMNGMSAMRDVMRDLAPMMQGQVPYDVGTVQNGAATLLEHSGASMNRLFPEEPVPAASYARPAIWEDWGSFAQLSEELKTYATGLAAAAPNGLTAPAPAATDMSEMAAMDGAAMQPAPAPEPEGFTIAELMGVAPAVPGRSFATDGATNASSQATSVEDIIAGVDFSTMAAPSVFEMVGQTCAACHAAYRNGS